MLNSTGLDMNDFAGLGPAGLGSPGLRYIGLEWAWAWLSTRLEHVWRWALLNWVRLGSRQRWAGIASAGIGWIGLARLELALLGWAGFAKIGFARLGSAGMLGSAGTESTGLCSVRFGLSANELTCAWVAWVAWTELGSNGVCSVGFGSAYLRSAIRIRLSGVGLGWTQLGCARPGCKRLG